LDSWTTLTDKEDLAETSDINKIKAALLAVQTELGADVAGTVTNLVTRLAVSLAGTGAIANGTSFPVSPIDGQLFYRSDENTLYVYNGSSWDSQGQSFSNVLFCWMGCFDTSNLATVTTSLTVPGTKSYLYFHTTSSTYVKMLSGKFKKTSGVSTVTILANIWSNSATGDETLQVDIGGANNTVSRENSAVPAWATASDIDVSGLTNGTVYDISISIKTDSSNEAMLGGIMLLGS